MNADVPSLDRTWRRKFGDALRGMRRGVRGQSSFFVHFFAAAAVVTAAAVMKMEMGDWCILLLCITMVLMAEMINSAIESLAKAIHCEEHPDLANALHIGSAAVFVAAIGAAVVGGIVFVRRLGEMLAWW
jgi:diacylglycerol kinase